jgi:hypothetical protein
MAAQTGYWLELPVLICYFFLKGTHSQNSNQDSYSPEMMLDSNRYSKCLQISARSSLQHSRHVPKLISQTSYWFELPVFICYFFLKGYTSTKPNSRLVFTRNDAGLKPLLQMTSNFGQVFPSTPQMSTQNGHANQLPV